MMTTILNTVGTITNVSACNMLPTFLDFRIPFSSPPLDRKSHVGHVHKLGVFSSSSQLLDLHSGKKQRTGKITSNYKSYHGSCPSIPTCSCMPIYGVRTFESRRGERSREEAKSFPACSACFSDRFLCVDFYNPDHWTNTLSSPSALNGVRV